MHRNDELSMSNPTSPHYFGIFFQTKDINAIHNYKINGQFYGNVEDAIKHSQNLKTMNKVFVEIYSFYKT